MLHWYDLFLYSRVVSWFLFKMFHVQLTKWYFNSVPPPTEKTSVIIAINKQHHVEFRPPPVAREEVPGSESAMQ